MADSRFYSFWRDSDGVLRPVKTYVGNEEKPPGHIPCYATITEAVDDVPDSQILAETLEGNELVVMSVLRTYTAAIKVDSKTESSAR